MPAAEIKKFWEQTRASLAEVDLNATVEPVEETDVFTMEGRIKTRTIYRVIMSSFEGRRIRAWYTVPSGQPPARGWPAIMEVTTGDNGQQKDEPGWSLVTLYYMRGVKCRGSGLCGRASLQKPTALRAAGSRG
ncbi:MAG: acetylxylan esterase [Chloroflexi bacterium]|nr:acetylxylan esterase [Chloroflexota bacterium]